MRCSSHTTVRSASLPMSHGRVARRGEADAALLGAGPGTHLATLRGRALVPCRCGTGENRGAGAPSLRNDPPMGPGGGERQEAARSPIAPFWRDRPGLVRQGTAVGEIAQRFHVGISTVYKRLHEVGTKMRPTRIKYGHVLTERRLRDLYLKRNARAEDIAATFGCDVVTVYNWLRRNGIPLKRPRRF